MAVLRLANRHRPRLRRFLWNRAANSGGDRAIRITLGQIVERLLLVSPNS